MVKLVGGVMAVTVAALTIVASAGTATTLADKVILLAENTNRVGSLMKGSQDIAQSLGWLKVDVAAGSWEPKQFRRLKGYIQSNAGAMVERFCGEVWPSTEDDARKLLTEYVRRDFK